MQTLTDVNTILRNGVILTEIRTYNIQDDARFTINSNDLQINIEKGCVVRIIIICCCP